MPIGTYTPPPCKSLHEKNCQILIFFSILGRSGVNLEFSCHKTTKL